MLAAASKTPETVPPANKITRGHSCILCQQRKVKCDRQKPCSNCIKARAECIPSAPTAPRRRRRKFSEQDLATKLRKYEQLLKKHGVKIEEDDHSDEHHNPADHPSETRYENIRALSLDVPRNPKYERAMLYSDKENSHYVENTLWENLRDEIQDPKDALQGSSDDEINQTMNEERALFPPPEKFFVGHGTSSKDLYSLHPQPVHIFRLWQTFLVNVNPLVKLFHAPTVQQIILDASGDLQNVPRNTEALMFAIYLLAITSLENADCETMFGDTRSNLLSKYSHGTQEALINAKFMRSLNLTTLNALCLYLLAVRKCYDPHSFWVLTGTAVRIAHRLGIHRDSSPQMSPFESEMRRRSWWQIIFLDGQASKLAGAGFPTWLTDGSLEVPLNVSDSDLSPGMKEKPVEKEGVTEMLFCCLRYEVVQALRKSGTFGKGNETKFQNGTTPELLMEKDKAIAELEARFHEKFIRHCDPSIPLHLLAIYVSKSVICTMRLMAHHPRQYPDKGASMPQSEKDMLMGESLKELEISAFGHREKSVRGYLWHIHVHFQLDAFIYVLSELRYRTSGPVVEESWKQVEVAYEQRPEMLKETKNSLYFAIGNLALKAWTKREESGYQNIPPPRFISVLRSQRRIPDPPTIAPGAQPLQQNSYATPSTTIDSSGGEWDTGDNFQTPQNQWDNSGYATMDMVMPDMAAVDWEYYQTMLDGELPAFTGQSWNV